MWETRFIYLFIYLPGRVRPSGPLFPSTRVKNVKYIYIYIYIKLKLRKITFKQYN